jgi:3-oxoacyl-[acyl-carrier protein] reductase
MTTPSSGPDFTGKIALVTGASRGIGRQLALALARQGATVVGTARSLDASPGAGGTLAGMVAEAKASRWRAEGIAAQITDPADARGLVEEVIRRHGRVDILCNNAGHLVDKTLSGHTDEEIHQTYLVNVFAPLALIRAVLPGMRAQGSGTIFNVTSGSGVGSPRPGQTVYSSTKAALDRATWVLAHEVRDEGVAVNSWWPGVVATDMTAGRLQGDPLEVVEESALWVMAQTAATFTGRTVRRGEFGTVYGPGID